MRLIVSIVIILISINCYGQADSIARVRKPVLQFLIGEHYRATELADQNKLMCKQQDELLHQITNYKELITSFRKDSLLCDSLVSLNKRTAISWKESFEAEKVAHKRAKNQIKKWKAITIGVAILGIILAARS